MNKSQNWQANSVIANREHFIDFPRHHSRHGTHAWRCLQTACETRKEWRNEQEGISVCGLSCGHVVCIHTHFCNTPAWKFNSFLSIVKISQNFPSGIFQKVKNDSKSRDWQCEIFSIHDNKLRERGSRPRFIRKLNFPENVYIVC